MELYIIHEWLLVTIIIFRRLCWTGSIRIFTELQTFGILRFQDPRLHMSTSNRRYARKISGEILLFGLRQDQYNKMINIEKLRKIRISDLALKLSIENVWPQPAMLAFVRLNTCEIWIHHLNTLLRWAEVFNIEYFYIENCVCNQGVGVCSLPH